jgi:hypothetical protein
VRRATLAVALALSAVTGACTDDIDPPWELDHERIIAVRATPPGLTAGQTARLDALIGKKGAKTLVAVPEQAIVTSPASLADTLSFDGTDWVVTAPSADRIAAARSELQLAADAPVPLVVGVSYAGQTLVATKTVELGRAGDNPALVNVRIDDAPAGTAEVVFDAANKLRLSVDADDVDFDVNWLTSCGTMHDFDLPSAYIKVEVDDKTSGELALVVRDAHVGGVADPGRGHAHQVIARPQ